MQFPSSFFEDEVRDGFYVPGMMKRAWAAQLEVLEDIDRVCKKHHLHYHADWGTLIGAIRHGGFIPWDDDMDISMPRKDYDTFLKVALDELPEGYGILNFEYSDDGDFKCDDYLIRVYNTGKIRLDQAFLEKFHGFPYAAGMDIFPMDNVPASEEEDHMLCEQVSILSTIGLGIGVMDPHEQEDCLQQVEKTYGVKFDRNKPMKRQIYMLAEQLCRSYAGEDSEYITMITSRTRWDYKIPRKYYEETLMLPFETGSIAVPAAYDASLRCKYKCYMELLRTGGGHEYPFYRRQERELEEKGRQIVGKYIFSAKELERVKESGQGTLKSYTEEMLRLFRLIQNGVMDAVSQGNFLLAAELLENCQEGAIALGTKIEETKGEGLAVIGVLEHFCEILYMIHEELATADKGSGVWLGKELEEILSELEKCAAKDVLNRRTVVFLPFKGSAWDAFESVWKAACADPDCDVYVIPVPYYEKALDGSLGKLLDETEQYPDYVELTNYKNYDFGLNHPDTIFIQNPFDNYNFTTSVHPFFYSENLQRFTDQLVYIPYFLLDEFEEGDGFEAVTMENICTVPGVVHADKVILQSEQMRLSYIKALTMFAGADTKGVWERKILGLGSPKTDREEERRVNLKLPEEWRKAELKPNASDKEVILYMTCPDALLEHGEKLLKKIENTLEFFKGKTQDIVVVWRPGLQREAVIKAMRPKLWQRYYEIVEKYRAEKWGICDDETEPELVAFICDAYYGDPSPVVRIFKRSGLPTMIQNVDILQKDTFFGGQSLQEAARDFDDSDRGLAERTVFETSQMSIKQLEAYIQRKKETVQKQHEKNVGAVIYEAVCKKESGK